AQEYGKAQVAAMLADPAYIEQIVAPLPEVTQHLVTAHGTDRVIEQAARRIELLEPGPEAPDTFDAARRKTLQVREDKGAGLRHPALLTVMENIELERQCGVPLQVRPD